MFDTVTTVLSSTVAQNGTFAVSYPTGRSAGDYSNAHKHVMFALGAKRTAPDDFTVSFGASSITVTHKGSTTLPVNTTVRIGFDRVGADDKDPDAVALPANVSREPLMLISLGSPATADADGVAASQSVSAGASFSLNGALVSNGVAVFDVPRNVVAAWTTTSILTIIGTDADGATVVEKSASGTSHTGAKAFKTVTSVSSSAPITSATVGTGNVLGMPRQLPHASHILQEFENGAPLARRPQKVFLTARVLCTDGTYGCVQVPSAGTIKSIRTVEVEGGITTNDAVLTFKIGTTAITNGVVTVATSGSAAGVKDTASPTAANAVVAGDAINVTVSGTPGGSKTVVAEFEIDLSAAQQLAGTFVAGVQTAATATTGDTRGTYTPFTTPDGATAVALLARVPDPADKGVAQYDG